MSGGVKKLAQVVVGAVIGFVQGGPVGAVIGAGLAFYAAEQQEKLNTKSPLRDNEPSAQTVRSSKAPVRYILGRVSTGGVLVWAQEERGAQTTGEWLHLVYVLCEGAIDELEYIYLGEELIGSYGADASYELVVNPTQVNTFLKENCPDWKDTQIGRGLSYVRISLRYSAEKFPSGIPDARFVVRGRNDIYDPRTGRSGWTENTALHLLWFLRTRCGVPDDEIVFETFASGANVCNESVQNPDGSSSPRYRSGCVIGADEQRTNVLQKLEAACAGKLIRVGGRWMFQAGAYYGPYDFEITEDMVIGTITGNTEATNDAAINTIRGTFIDPLQSWTETDYPEVSVAQWVEEDGGEAAETLSFSYVSDPYQAQRLANIELRRRRSGGALNIPLNLAGYNCRPGRAVRVNLPSLNILGEFMVTNWSMGTSEGCTASVQAYEAAIFDDAVGKPYNPIGFIKLPAGGLGSPTNLRWDVEDTAEISQGVLSWDRPAGIVSGFAVTVRQVGAAVQALQVPETTTRMPISGLTSGSYTMGVSALGPLARSGEATITVDVNGPPMPETCAVQATIDTITLIPGNTLHGLNGGTYEYFWSPDPAATQGEFLGRGLSITHTGLSFAKTYAYFVRSKNAYGVSAFLKVVAATSMDVGAILEGIKGKITESELGKELTSRIDLIDKNGPGSVNERVGAAKTELAKQISDVNNALGTVKGNLEQQITAVSADVSAAKTDLQQQIANVSALAGSLPYRKDKAYSVGQSALGSDGKLYQALKAVPLNTPPPNTSYWTDVGQAVVTANGMAARVSKVETDVSTIDGKVTAQASQISGLQSSLTTTNGNVSAAQQAAQDAATLAGGKGKVIVQSAAPAVTDRLAQNLWIDTTSNANTPKRWTGSTWAAVTDKAATDAAAAAANALALAQTKADASVVSSLTTRVSDAEGKLTSQATRMDGMQTSIDGKASSQALQQVTSRVTATEDKDKAQDQLISSQSQALTSLTDSVSKKAEASTVTQLANDVKAQGNTLSAQGSSLTKIETSLPSISGENLLANSSFEEVIADGTRPRHWAISGAAARAFVPSPLTSSLNALRINATVGAGSYIEVVSSPADGRARVKVTAGVTYTLSVYARGSGAPGFLRMYLQFLDAAGAVLSAPATSDKPVLGENFTRYTLTGTAPANATQVNVYACRLFNDSSAAANIWAEIDNVQLQEGGLATAYHPSILAAADASAEAVTSLGARVDKNEQGLKSTGEQVTRLTSSLVITDGNVDKAQKAAQDAYGLADGKGKVIVQSAAPATTDRLPQNLWIDTTGNANTPKRWTGSAWLAVTDKVATDAAAAAQNALNQLGGKADASALANLGSTVEQHGKDITAAGQSITRIDASIASSGAENLLFNPSFDVASASNSGLADGWGWRKTATVVVTPSLRDADLGAEGKCQRLDISGFTAGSGSTYLDFVPSAVNPDVRPPVYEGIINTASVFVRGNTGLTAQIYLQYKDAAGTTLSTDGPANIALTPTYQRLSLTSNPAPANAVKMDVLFRIRSSPGSSLTGGFVDLDKAQLELGQVATGWRDNGKAASTIAAANAAATTALAGRVSKTEEGLTSASSQLTQLDNSLGDVGGENLFYNPGFTKAASSNGSPEGWETEGPVTTTDTLVTSWMNAGEKAQRIVAPGLTNSTQYKSLRPSATKRIKVSSGQAVTASIYARKSDSDVGMRIFIQWVNTAGAVISAPNSALIPLTIAGSRVTFSAVAPSGSAEAYVYFRIYAMTPTATNGTIEFARPQAEYGNRATGWRDNGQVNSDAVGAVSVAVDGLTSSVSQQGKDITSVSGRTTTLENSVNSTTDGLSTKASSSALNSVAGRVSSTESGLTAQATSISNLEAKVGAAQAFVAGQTWEFTGSTQGWGANTAGATLTAGPLFVTVAKYTTIQATNTFPKINGAENPLLRIRLRRRNTGRSVASMYWANEDGGLAEARRINWPINTATTDWQDIEIDLSGHAGWNGKNIWAIRLDMYNSGDANGEVDIAYIAAGRRSVAASGRAFDSLSVNVSQQGDKLAAETQRINGLQSSVGDANAAIQSEASTRASADAAMGKRVDGVQSSLGSTNAAVQQISTAQANLDGKVNATWSVKLGLTSGGSYYAAGFGLGLENQGGTFQSSFVVLANRFSVLNPVGEGLVNIFTAENGQVVMNDALISKLTVQRAIVGSSINSSELANDGTPIMRMDFASGTLILLNKAATAYTVYNRRGIDMVINGVRRIRMGEWD